MDQDKEICLENLKPPNLQLLFNGLKDELRVRGLLSPYSLHGKEIRSLCDGYFDTIEKGMALHILTAYDFTVSYFTMPTDFRRAFLDFLSRFKVLITLDWETMGTSVTHSVYDNGLRLPRDKREIRETDCLSRCKGECDASFKVVKDKDGNSIGQANLAIMVWRDNEIIWSELNESIDCENSVEAELLGMALLLKRAMENDITNLEVCTDCDMVDRVMRGEHIITENDKLKDLYYVLRGLRGCFKALVCRWVPHEVLTIVDHMTKMKEIMTKSKSEGNFTLISTPKEWDLIFSGEPIFSIREMNSKLRNSATKRVKCPGDLLTLHKVCYYTVSEDKVGVLWHIGHALKARNVSVIAGDHGLELLYQRSELFGDYVMQKIGPASYKFKIWFGIYMDKKSSTPSGKSEHLYFVIDPELYREELCAEASLTVVLVTEEERQYVKDIIEFSPISFVSFKSKRNQLEDP